jgi:hypothetical protein
VNTHHVRTISGEVVEVEDERVPYIKYVLLGTAAFVGLVVLLAVLSLGWTVASKNVHRTQARKDATNAVAISSIEIRNQEQRIQVAKQQAEIRLQNAIGVREAQDEIAKTLTPLYVQFEMVEALKEIARSGKNNSVVFLPSGANGIPLVSTIDPTKVGQPDATPSGG